MCRLLGIYGQIDFWQESVLGFRRQAEFGKIPPSDDVDPGHKDGWGLAGSSKETTAMVPIIRRLGSAMESGGYHKAVTSMDDEVPEVHVNHAKGEERRHGGQGVPPLGEACGPLQVRPCCRPPSLCLQGAPHVQVSEALHIR